MPLNQSRHSELNGIIQPLTINRINFQWTPCLSRLTILTIQAMAVLIRRFTIYLYSLLLFGIRLPPSLWGLNNYTFWRKGSMCSRNKLIVLILNLFILSIGVTAGYAEPERVAMKVGYLPITDHLLLGVSKEKDSASFKSLDLQPIKFSDWATISEALRSKSLDAAFLLAPLAFQTKLKGGDIKVVLLGHRDGSALIVSTQKPIASALDLRGRSVAIPSRFSTHNMLLNMFLEKAGLNPSTDLKTIEMAPPEMPSALATNQVDGYIVAEPFGAKGELSGAGKVLVLSTDIWKHHPDCLLVVQNDFLKKHGNAIQDLVLSLIRAGLFVEAHRDEGARIGSQFLGHSEQVLFHALTKPSTDRVTFLNLAPQTDELERIQSYMGDKLGLFPQRVTMNDLVDSTFARNAYESLKGK